MNEEKYYQIEIINPDTACEKKIAYLLHTKDIELLFEDLTNKEEIVEFSGVMHFNDKVIDEEDEVGSTLYDHNIIKITNIRKVKV